jgi:hypothetical protein
MSTRPSLDGARNNGTSGEASPLSPPDTRPGAGAVAGRPEIMPPFGRSDHRGGRAGRTSRPRGRGAPATRGGRDGRHPAAPQHATAPPTGCGPFQRASGCIAEPDGSDRMKRRAGWVRSSTMMVAIRGRCPHCSRKRLGGENSVMISGRWSDRRHQQRRQKAGKAGAKLSRDWRKCMQVTVKPMHITQRSFNSCPVLT